MRVAQVCDLEVEAANGVSRAVATLVEHLARLGVELECWNISSAVPAISDRTIRGVRVLDLPARGRALGMLAGLPDPTRDAIRQRRVDLVHFHSVFIGHNVHAARLLGVPYVVTPHGGYAQAVLDGSNRFAKRLWLAGWEERYLQRARVVHAVSEAERDALRQRWPGLSIRYVPNAVDLPDLIGGVPPASDDFVFLGRLATDHKGLDIMLRGFARFARRGGTGRLVLAGPDWRGCRATLQRLAEAEGMADRVVFPGPVFAEAKTRLLAGARAFVHTSRWEGLPLAVLEAMANATPVLVTPETNLAAIVTRYRAGVVCRGDPDAIADAFSALASAPEAEKRSRRQAARRLVEENFGWPRVRRDLMRLYEDAVATPPGTHTANPVQ
ncbi:glycosyltransferase family 4 protein [Falsiroseomonas oryzae]|uniref:glycosyltransferase family 4 protein n=1 Tax=Falsiroseomonas oryzae TaxID=2766473 RepID=UPI0022EB2566|nr:glycosyltransferase family 4 protein [Roseomonas sp. MO-31]